ncbi:hypothetical protein EPN90_03980 [Patescibacteria group bacterium]|nr:MAG: hypothetical protein EPN90_03980 [Patescibacteria group bacterium]
MSTNNKKVQQQRIDEFPDAVGLSVIRRAEKREGTRSSIALFYVIGYLVIIAGVLIMSAIKNFTISDNKDMLLAISGILSGPLGFIIGYYFKAANKEE